MPVKASPPLFGVLALTRTAVVVVAADVVGVPGAEVVAGADVVGVEAEVVGVEADVLGAGVDDFGCVGVGVHEVLVVVGTCDGDQDWVGHLVGQVVDVWFM